MNNTDDTFIAGGPGSSPSGFSNDDDATFIEGGIAAEIEGAARYQIESEIGRGGMAIVYLATDAKLNRKVALKRIGGDLFPSGSSGRRQSINLLKTEAQSLANLQHSNIVYVYDVGMDGDGMYMAMEYVDGGTLKDRILEDGPLNPEETARMGFQLCDALSMVHEKGIVHRDIKPGNVLLTKRGMPKLADFDLVLDTASNREVAGAFLGTLHYMSPEQRVDSGQVDFRSDLYSLGATLYFAATGSVPEKIDPDKIHESLRSVIQKALQENPLFRFSSAMGMKKAFEEVLKAQVSEQAPGGHAAGSFPCYSCSKPVPNGAVYCPECGKDLIDARREIEKEFNHAISTSESFVAKDSYKEALDLLNRVMEKVKHQHFFYFKKRMAEKLVWVGEEEKNYREREEELTQEFHKAQEALAVFDLEKASEAAGSIVKEERRFGALSDKAKEIIQKCQDIVERRAQFDRNMGEAALLADANDFDKAFALLPSLTDQDAAYADQSQNAAELKSKLLGKVKRLEEGLKSRLQNAQATLDNGLLDDAFHEATEVVTEAEHITYKNVFKDIADNAKELTKSCHNQVVRYLVEAWERADKKSFGEAYALLDKVLNLSAAAYPTDRENAAEGKIKFRGQELEHHITVAAERVSKKDFEEAFRVLNLVLDENSERYKELKAKANVAMILAKRKRFWRKVRVPLVIVILALGGLSYGYYHYYLSHSPGAEWGKTGLDSAGTSIREAPLPKHSVDTLYVMESINHSNPNLNYVAERKIVSLEGNRMKVSMRNVNSSYVRNLEYDYQWNLISVRGASGEGSDFSPPLKYYDFPLKPGKRWRGVSKERNIKTGQLREHTLEAEVEDWENVSVSAGKFRAIKVKIKNKLKDLQTGQISYGTDTSWYAPEARRSVKSKLTASDTPDGEQASQTIELIRYSIR